EKNKDKKIEKIILSNLTNLEKIIDYNIKNNIHFYRLTSKLIPLATHEQVTFEYILKYRKYYEIIGKKIKKSKMRVDVHPDQFTVLNSTKPQVIANTIKILQYHYQILKALKIQKPIIILHVGSNVFGKKPSLTRFVNNFNKLPKKIQKTIVIENDDKVFNIDDVLNLTSKLKIPFVLDYHHHLCNSGDCDIENYFTKIFETWTDQNPKIHFSTSKNQTKKDFRSHNDFINVDDFIKFIEKIKQYNVDIDIMLEAKFKDEALFRLIRLLKYKTNYKFIDETSFEV
ncbi:MAG: UV DNA damage repair endonuclease UvsE, partial [Bacilli bacterium]